MASFRAFAQRAARPALLIVGFLYVAALVAALSGQGDVAFALTSVASILVFPALAVALAGPRVGALRGSWGDIWAGPRVDVESAPGSQPETDVTPRAPQRR